MEYEGNTDKEKREDWLRKLNETLNLTEAAKVTLNQPIVTQEPKIIKEKEHYYD